MVYNIFRVGVEKNFSHFFLAFLTKKSTFKKNAPLNTPWKSEKWTPSFTRS